MRTTKTEMVATEVTDDVRCNKCGGTCRVTGPGEPAEFDGLIEARVHGGYLSPTLPDLSAFAFSLCEPCLGALFGACKIPPEEFRCEFSGGVGSECAEPHPGAWVGGRYVPAGQPDAVEAAIRRAVAGSADGVAMPDAIGAVTREDPRVPEWKARHAAEALLERGEIVFDAQLRLRLREQS